MKGRIETADVLSALPAADGHFLLESGHHTDLWLTLDGLFVNPTAIQPLVDSLAERIRPYAVTAVCGPLLGGAFLAQALATALNVEFYYVEARVASDRTELFSTEYHLTPDLRHRIRGHRVALVDDVISAGSSVRATLTALTHAGASATVVGALMFLGDIGLAHFTAHGVPVETLVRRPLALWAPAECPLCEAGVPLEKK